jgi:hypothetical protein
MTVILGVSLFLLMPLLCGSEFDPLCLWPSFLLKWQQSLYTICAEESMTYGKESQTYNKGIRFIS